MAEEFTRSLKVDARHVAEIKANAANLSKIAAKLGLDPVTVTVDGWEVEQRPTYLPDTTFRIGTRDVEVAHLTIVGQTPVLPGGWTFLGAIEHLEAGNLVHGNDERLRTFRDVGPNCDHCNLDRRRAKTVVVVSEDGTLAQVGSSCMKDYLGYHNDPEHLHTYVTRLFDEESWFGPGDPAVRNLMQVLAVAAYVIRKTGWVSKAQANGSALIATADIVSVLVGFSSVPKNDNDPLKVVLDKHFKGDRVGKDDESMAGEVRDWVRAIPADTDSDYLHNLRVAIEEGVVTAKHLGLVVSAQGAMQRAREREIERAERNANAPVAVPVVEGRQTVVGKIISTKWRDGYMGEPVLKMLVSVTAEGGAFKVWGTVPSSVLGDVEAGTVIRFDATVERSNDDPTFGFFKRPSKAVVLATA